MTTPMERARSLRYAYELLQEVQTSQTPPPNLQRWARVTLRHFPTPSDVAYQAALPGWQDWLGPELPEPYRDFDALIRTHDDPAYDLAVWTAWLVHRDERQILRRCAVIGYAKGMQGARALFASRFGLDYVTPGLRRSPKACS